MTQRSISLYLAALTLACGPSEATTTTADGDTSGTTDASTSTDEGTSMPVDPDDATTSPPTTAGDDGDDGDATTTGADEDESTFGSSESGGEGPVDGRFEITGTAATIEPEGCAADRGDGPPDWTIQFALPGGDGMFTMVEMFGPYVGNFDCTLAGTTFTCARETVVDYAFANQDAVVTLASTYDASWDDDGLVGDYSADFACDGVDCASVVADWQLTAFPCAVQVPFTGALVSGR